MVECEIEQRVAKDGRRDPLAEVIPGMLPCTAAAAVAACHTAVRIPPLARSPRAVRLQAAAARRFAGAAAVRGTVRVALAAASRAAASAVVVVLLPLLLLLVAAASAAAVCSTRQEEDRVHHELAANNLRLIPQGIALRYHVEFRQPGCWAAWGRIHRLSRSRGSADLGSARVCCAPVDG